MAIATVACQPQPTSEPEPAETALDPPALVGPGAVSTELPEFATALDPGGETLYFNRTPPDRSRLEILQARKADGEWQAAEPLAFSDGAYRDLDPFVSRDGSRLYFTSNRPEEGEGAEDFDLWYAPWEGSGWGAPVNLGAPVNGEGNEFFCSLTNGGALYFSAVVEGSEKTAIFRAPKEGDGFGEPVRVDLGLDESTGVGNPASAPDESFLIFVSEDLGGEGGADLFIAPRGPSGEWGEVRNLGPEVNSSAGDFAPFIDGEGERLYFTSERPGVVAEWGEGRPPGDLYGVELAPLLRGLL